MRSPSAIASAWSWVTYIGGDAEAAQQLIDLEPQRIAQLGIERGERLVQQQGARLHGQRARQRHALALAA